MKTAHLSCLAMVVLAGCSSHPTSSAIPDPSGTCFDAHRVDTSIFEPVDDSGLRARAVRLPDSGGVRCATVYRLKDGRGASLHRVFGGGAWRYGRWWTFPRPGSDSTAYRSAYEICRGWNRLDSLLTCDLKPGTHLAIGPGQSAWCASGPCYGTSDSLQVFLANPTIDLDTSRCTVAPMIWR